MKSVFTLLLSSVLLACSVPEPPARSVTETLGGRSDDGFSRATEVREFVFPEDHGLHRGYKAEWWYFTGNLESEEGDRFGYQLTLFRFELTPMDADENGSEWRTNTVWMGHFAVSDAQNKIHYSDERFSREAPGIAGTTNDPVAIWMDDWLIEHDHERKTWSINIQAEEIGLTLSMQESKPIVLQGDRGLSQKGHDPGNASYYYTIPRLASEGSVRVNGKAYTVSGASWLDREWSTSALEDGTDGWDWFALQFDNNTEVMYYQLRLEDGTPHPLSAGKWIKADGSVQTLTPDDMKLTPTQHWTAESGTRYPVEWRMESLLTGETWRIAAIFEDQEMTESFRYWEGAIDIFDVNTDLRLGRGYLEQTGYP